MTMPKKIDPIVHIHIHTCEASLDVLHELPTYFLERIDTERTVFVGLARDLSL